ncbi:hypothetical protein M3Y97_00970100 [Aphelenchoides bicaudatus]|nr:hypothetical protein M3Y97_00970100 [Aphelenchoides bicaudatus]
MSSALPERVQKLTSRIRERLRSIFESSADTHEMEEQLVATASTVTADSSNPDRQGGYTELIGGTVPCPSCSGSGFIPKELESTLVALIPLNDERLKPKRTWRYILLWVVLCFLIGGSVIFFLMPRTVTLSSDVRVISVVNVTKTDNATRQYIDFNFSDRLNVSSGNYLPISIINVTATIVSKFQPWSVDQIGNGFNNSISENNQLTVYGKSQTEVLFRSAVSLTGYVSEYCQSQIASLTSLYVTMQFDVAVTLQYYYGHQEQVFLRINQQVCCIPSGNCTMNT